MEEQNESPMDEMIRYFSCPCPKGRWPYAVDWPGSNGNVWRGAAEEFRSRVWVHVAVDKST